MYNYIVYMLEVAKQQVCMSVSCMLHTFLKYRDHYTSIIVAAPKLHCNYYMYVHASTLQMYVCICCSAQTGQHEPCRVNAVLFGHCNRFVGYP